MFGASLTTRIEAELRLRELQAAQTAAAKAETLADWLPRVSPSFNWTYPHVRYLVGHLDRVTSGEINKLLIEMPPRHFKSETCTIRYPIYRMARDPKLRVIVGAYNQTLADRFSRKARRLAREVLNLDRERRAVDEWETEQGGGMRAAGVGAGVTGGGADLIVIDDPVKNREEAESVTVRDRVYDWFTNDIYTRAEPNAAFVVIMTRWHKDDLIGRILVSEDGPNWIRLRLPALAEPDDPLGRQEGAALCPDRYNEAALAAIRVVMGRDFSALYQQSPQNREGGSFKESHFVFVDAVPAEARRVRWWDKASSLKGDYTAGVLLAEHRGIYYVEDVKRGRWEQAERDRQIRATSELDRLTYPTPVEYGGWQDPGDAGKDAAAAFVRLLAGFTVEIKPATGSKELRADPFAAQCQAGNVRILRRDWAPGFIAEACDFPNGANDDQIEQAAAAFAKLAAGSLAFSY